MNGHGGPRLLASHSWHEAPSCLKEKKYGQILCDQATYISVQSENGISKFKSAPRWAWGCSIVFIRAFR